MSKQQHRRASDISNRLIDEIVDTKPRSKTLRKRKESEQFLRQYFADVPYEDMAGRSTTVMGQAAVAHLDFGRVRRSKKALLRIFNPDAKTHGYQSAFTIIEMVNDNMPFLVDSISAALGRHGLTIHMTVHPLFRVRRDNRGRLEHLADINDDAEPDEAETVVLLDSYMANYRIEAADHALVH